MIPWGVQKRSTRLLPNFECSSSAAICQVRLRRGMRTTTKSQSAISRRADRRKRQKSVRESPRTTLKRMPSPIPATGGPVLISSSPRDFHALPYSRPEMLSPGVAREEHTKVAGQHRALSATGARRLVVVTRCLVLKCLIDASRCSSRNYKHSGAGERHARAGGGKAAVCSAAEANWQTTLEMRE